MCGAFGLLSDLAALRLRGCISQVHKTGLRRDYDKDYSDYSDYHAGPKPSGLGHGRNMGIL